IEKQMIVSQNSRKTMQPNAQNSIASHAKSDLTEKEAMNLAKKDFHQDQQEAGSAAMKINREKDFQNQVLPGGVILIDLKDQREANLIVTKISLVKEVFRNQVSEKVVQIDSIARALKSQREVDSIAI